MVRKLSRKWGRKAKAMSFDHSKRMGVHKVVRGVQPDSDSGCVWSVRKDDPKSDSWETENKTYTYIPGGGERLMFIMAKTIGDERIELCGVPVDNQQKLVM